MPASTLAAEGCLPDLYIFQPGASPRTSDSAMSNVSFTARQASAAPRYVRRKRLGPPCSCVVEASTEKPEPAVLRVLARVQGLLQQGIRVTQRDLYYQLKGAEFPSPTQVSQALQDAVALLQVPRARLHVTCAGKGALGGAVHVRCRGLWIDVGSMRQGGGWPVPGDLDELLALDFQAPCARYLVVVEKDAVFQRLLEDGLHLRLPCILITARGMPDLATRVLVARLHEHFSELPVLGMADWNPAGCLILKAFKFGTKRLALEAAGYTVPGLQWLGPRLHHLADSVDPAQMQPLTNRDRALIRTLRTEPLLQALPEWLAELDAMDSKGVKCEIEALYPAVGGIVGFTETIARLMLQQDAV